MIEDKSFSKKWMESFRAQEEHGEIQTNILERMIYALHLLEHLGNNGLEFVFKGGTSLVLLLGDASWFSIDIDIITDESRNKIENVLDDVIKTSKFKQYELDERRSYKAGVPKAHYKFEFDSEINTDVPSYILLDILLEAHRYPDISEIPINTKWVEVRSPLTVKVPTIDSITGDKLTAFSPTTIGIPYFKGKVECGMEICKQLYDLSRLFERISDIESVKNSFYSHAHQEIAYRSNEHAKSELTPIGVLKDIIFTSRIITRRGKEEPENFEILQRGIKGFGSGFLMQGRFRLEQAIAAASKIAYLAAKLQAGDTSPIKYYDAQDITDLLVESPDWNFLNKLKKQQDKSAFFYWYQAVQYL